MKILLFYLSNFLTLIFLAPLSYISTPQNNTDYIKLHFDAIVIDAHNDIVQRMLAGEDISKRSNIGHSDLPRFLEGGIDVQVFSIWVQPTQEPKNYFKKANEQIDAIEKFVKKNNEKVLIAKSVSDIENAASKGKFAIMLGMEGGHHIENNLKKLEHFYKRGVRYMSLTWNNSTEWASSSKDETESPFRKKRKGLTNFGKKVVQKMNELGIIVDVSHVGEKTFWDIIKVSTQPIIASHSAVWSLCHHHRNLKDDQIKAIAKSGGVVCINFVPSFIDSTFAYKEKVMREQNKVRIDSFRLAYKGNQFLQSMYLAEFLKAEYLPILPTIDKLIDHIDYIVKLVGVDYVGLGSDFDGMSVTPKDMNDVTFLPHITRELVKRGYPKADIEKILGGNFIRVLKTVENK